MSNNVDDKQQKEQDEDFSLYTEKIVINPFVKYKKFFSILKLIGAAVIFGLIASIVIAVMVPYFNSVMVHNEPQTDDRRNPLVLDKDEYPYDPIEPESSTELSTEAETEAEKMSPAQIIERARKSIVVIDINEEDMNSEIQDTVSSTKTVGLIVGENDDEYIIMTGLLELNGKNECVVTFGDSDWTKAVVTGINSELQMTVIAVNKEDLTSSVKTDFIPAQLGNSYILKPGDSVMAIGRLYGKMLTFESSTITGISSKSVIDGAFDVLQTGITPQDMDYCFLFNELGEVIGVSRNKVNTENLYAAGVSDLKSLIELLTTGQKMIYLGVEAVNVTNAMAVKYELPRGIYINNIVVSSPAYDAGLQVGDIIVGFNGSTILTIQSFSEKLYKCSEGDIVTISVKRGGSQDYREFDFSVKLLTR